MRIALDYDGTFTNDPELWVLFAHLAKTRGHTVFILTRRWKEKHPGNFNRPVPEEGMFKVIYCEDKDKIPVMREQGETADVFIDDRPWELGQ